MIWIRCHIRCVAHFQKEQQPFSFLFNVWFDFPPSMWMWHAPMWRGQSMKRLNFHIVAVCSPLSLFFSLRVVCCVPSSSYVCCYSLNKPIDATMDNSAIVTRCDQGADAGINGGQPDLPAKATIRRDLGKHFFFLFLSQKINERCKTATTTTSTCQNRFEIAQCRGDGYAVDGRK